MGDIQDYIKKQEPDKQKIINKLRKILKKTLPGIKEHMEYGVLCYENYYYIAALPKQVNFGFSIIGLTKEEVKLFEGTGKTMRHYKVHSLKTLDEKELIKRIKLVRKKAKPVHQ
jgi:hypothetical protein